MAARSAASTWVAASDDDDDSIGNDDATATAASAAAAWVAAARLARQAAVAAAAAARRGVLPWRSSCRPPSGSCLCCFWARWLASSPALPGSFFAVYRVDGLVGAVPA